MVSTRSAWTVTSLILAFSYGSSFLDGTITLNNVTDGTNAPRFIGGLFVTSSNMPGFGDGGYSDLDFNAYLGNNPTIDQVLLGNGAFHPGPSLVRGTCQAQHQNPQHRVVWLWHSGTCGCDCAAS